MASTVGVLLGQAGGFAAATTYSTGGSALTFNNQNSYRAMGVALGDVNGDGRLDIVANNYFDGTVGVLLGQAGGSFAATTTVSTLGNYPMGVALGDVNGDGRLDIVETNWIANTAGVLLNTTASASSTLMSLSPTSGPVGTHVTLTGTNLSSATAVRFNGTAATTFAVVSATSLTATVPTGATSGNVTLTMPGGTSNGLGFTVTGPVMAAAGGLAVASVSVYPNPAHERLLVLVPAGAGASSVQAELVNALGQVVRTQTTARPAAGAAFTVETAGLAPGVYSLRLRAGASVLTARVALQ